METTDEALCRLVADRDEAAFDRLVARYQERAYRIVWSIVRDGEDARDVSQDAFVRLWETAASFRGTARFSTWFYRLLVNLALDRRRRDRWWHQVTRGRDRDDDAAPTLERLPAVSVDPIDDLDRRDVMKRVWDAAGALPPRQRAVLHLQVREEMSTEDVATVLECSEATVRVHLHRALMTLRGRLGARTLKETSR
ncbi:MAG: sigma-70 family RNA polymerase sigma factor [Candidatus Rokubacteria bacterium]|nr:sigma-70 family RNA polymerase sigma factor [Candidatus Rokubacteria bacterium]